jgi:branched-chain amino acid transport system substrate-binding protein
MLGSFQSEVSESSGGKVPEMAQAWVKWTNAHGGVNGHPVSLTVIDDHDDPAQAVAGAKKMIADHVMAIAPEESLQSSAYQAILENSGIPAIGGLSFNKAQTSSPDWFPVGAPLTDAVYGMLAQEVKAGKTKFGVLYCAEAPSCAGIGPLTSAILKIIGKGSVVYQGSVSATAPNYTAQCLAGKQAGVQTWWVGDSSNIDGRIVKDCEAQGFHPVNLTCCSAIGSVSKNWGPDGSIYSILDIPVTTKSEPGMQQFYAALAQYAPDLKPSNPQFTDTLTQSWAGLELFKAAAEKANIGPTSTPAQLKAGLYALKDETLGGITPPLNYVKGKSTQIHCWYLETPKSGNVVAVSTEPQCVPTGQVAALAKLGG